MQELENRRSWTLDETHVTEEQRSIEKGKSIDSFSHIAFEICDFNLTMSATNNAEKQSFTTL